MARVLLEAGSDCNAIDQGNNTPLHMLASVSTGDGSISERTGDAGLVALLLEWGASADVKNSKGLTPMSAALDTRNRATVLAYRAFFGEDSGLALTLDVDVGRENSTPSSIHQEQTSGGQKATENGTTAGEPVRERKTVSA